MGEFDAAGEARTAHSWDVGEDGDERDFVVESGMPSFSRLLTRRQKLLRGGVALLVVVMAAFALLGGPEATASLLGSLRQPVAAAAQVPFARVRELAAVRLPPGAATFATLQVSPEAGGRGGAYACWVTPEVTPEQLAGGAGLGTLRVTALDSGAEPWRALDPPVAAAVRCGVVADAVNPRQALLAVYARTGSSAACSLPDLYVTGDGGATWQAAVWPDPNVLVCTVHLDFVDGTIYATASNALLSLASRPAGSAGRLIVSADSGQTWWAGDAGLGATSDFELAGIRPGGRLLAETFDARRPEIGTLWESLDSGRSWRSRGELPGANPRIYVSRNPAETADGGWGRLYMSAEAQGNGASGGKSPAFFATATLGSEWSVLPSLPTVPSDDNTGSSGGTESGGVGPGGLLFVTRAMIGSNAHDFIPQQAVWIWAPRLARWLLSPVGLPANTLVQGTGWSGPAMSLWVTVIHQGIPPTVQIAALVLTAQG